MYYNGDNVCKSLQTELRLIFADVDTFPVLRVLVPMVGRIIRTFSNCRPDFISLGYSMTLFQSLATAAGYDPVKGPGSSCLANDASGQCVLPWAGGTKAVSSIVLVANGVSFAVMTAIFTTIGSAADYGSFGRWLLFVITVICWAAQFASMSLTCKSIPGFRQFFSHENIKHRIVGAFQWLSI